MIVLKSFNFLRGIFKRYKLHIQNSSFKCIGENCDIKLGEYSYSQNIEIGDNVYIGPKASFMGMGGINIGNGVIIGPRVTIRTANHNYNSDDLTSIPYDGKIILKPVIVEDNVWIGDHAFICPGVRIGEGSVVAMGSVVSKDVPKYAVVAGNPAKVVKYRNKDVYENLKKNKKIYLELKKENNIKYSTELQP